MKPLSHFLLKNLEKPLFNEIYKNFLIGKFPESDIYKFSNFLRIIYRELKDLKVQTPISDRQLVLKNDQIYVEYIKDDSSHSFVDFSYHELLNIPLKLDKGDSIYQYILYKIITYYG